MSIRSISRFGVLTLKTKTALLFATGLLSILLSSLFITRYFFLLSIDQLELDQIVKANRQAESVIERIVEAQNERAYDWAHWDESYLLLKQGDPGYYDRNLGLSTLDTLGLDLIAYLQTDFTVTESLYRNMDGKGFELLLEAFLRSKGMNAHIARMKTVLDGEKHGISGIIKGNGELWIISLTPVRDSEGESEMVGWQIWGQHLSYRFPHEYSGILSAENEILYDQQHDIKSTDEHWLLDSGIFVHKDDQILSAHSPLVGLGGETLAILHTEVPRAFYSKGNRLFLRLIIIVLAVAIAITTVTVFLFRIQVGNRFKHLEHGITRLFDGNELPERKTKDEFERITELVSHLAQSSSVNEDKLSETLQKFEALYQSQNMGMMLVVDKVIVDSNLAVEQMLGYKKHELQSMSLENLCAAQAPHHCKVEDMYAAIEQGQREFEAELNCKNGEFTPCHIEISVIELQSGQSLMLSVKDLSEQKQQQELIQTLTTKDTMSGFLNKPATIQHIERSLVENEQTGTFAVLYITFSRLSETAEVYGLAFYDRVVKHLVESIKSNVDCNQIGRVSEHEFLIIANNHCNTDALWQIGETLVERYGNRAAIGGIELELGMKAVMVDNEYVGANFESLFQLAQYVTNRSQHFGGKKLQSVDSALLREAQNAQAITRDLLGAVQRNEFFAHFQPIVDCSSQEINGFEALARWIHPVLGNVSPAVFIPLAEKQKLIVEIGEQILEQACQFISEINNKTNGVTAKPLTVHVNLSSPHFYHTSLVSYLASLIEKYSIKSGQLTLEITESMLMVGESDVIERMALIKQLGVHLALDDFGTGYSSFSTLCTFPLDVVKLDRSYIDQLEHNEKARTLVRSIASMSHELGLTIVAEGVETSSQYKKLKVWNIDEVQGFYFYKPMGEGDAKSLIIGKD